MTKQSTFMTLAFTKTLLSFWKRSFAHQCNLNLIYQLDQILDTFLLVSERGARDD